ncbi:MULTISPECIES: hypothetical protein [unclassified Rhizobium]|uniref:hypothetical protein n=1 Tax=unclassified Rhizobium TaxID=2613769 RepID=UPI001A97EF3A|nr:MULTISPECIES: hypothetical protein [unclassified Rhizobium]MBX5160126.1 hypothetical protein [Rhizobium sp. NZLR8]MBX5165597.1 hypothetical protein [Rhizobium sp. NZLR4b]MBX5171866.1 hypothetical protein [Rhizobium sp. NZLR1b]MBX5193125.1 hypothetical protein [Rhizobium sp. NZLR3b]MBX5197165.1 hypothetical protein [Rhizobium sp. NZLR10]
MSDDSYHQNLNQSLQGYVNMTMIDPASLMTFDAGQMRQLQGVFSSVPKKKKRAEISRAFRFALLAAIT